MTRKMSEEEHENLKIVNIRVFIYFLYCIYFCIYCVDSDVQLNHIKDAKVKLPVLERIADM